MTSSHDRSADASQGNRPAFCLVAVDAIVATSLVTGAEERRLAGALPIHALPGETAATSFEARSDRTFV